MVKKKTKIRKYVIVVDADNPSYTVFSASGITPLNALINGLSEFWGESKTEIKKTIKEECEYKGYNRNKGKRVWMYEDVKIELHDD